MRGERLSQWGRAGGSWPGNVFSRDAPLCRVSTQTANATQATRVTWRRVTILLMVVPAAGFRYRELAASGIGAAIPS